MSTSAFSLAGQSLKLDDAASIESHIKALQDPSAATKITSIDFSGNTIGVPAAEALAPHLSSLSSLESANLADIFTSRLLSEIPPALDALLKALLKCSKLHTINLSDNAFGLNTQAPLVSYLERASSLRHLILNNNGLGPEAGTLIANALSKLAAAKEQAGRAGEMLETIVCGRNRLENGSSVAWAGALEAHAKSLKEVRMSQNGIRVEGITKILRQGLKGAAGLQVVDLQDNLFTVPGAQAFCDIIVGCENLKEVQISDTLLRRRGGILLAEALAKGKNKQLEVLRFQYNEVNAKGIQGLVDAIKAGSLPKLRRVDMNGNQLSEDDPAIESLREILDQRKEEAGIEDEDEGWGLDELDELDDDSDAGEDDEEDAAGEDDGGDEGDAIQKKAEKDLQAADEAEAENVAPRKDAEVDDLADKLEKTGL